jgi:uncharacterized protein YqjF (DUF2071 family)
LRSLVPPRLSIDTFEGRAYVGLVPFTMNNVRPLVPLPGVPGAADFHETNVRTYVHLDGAGPGVFFFSLEAASRLAVWAARTFFHLPYHHARRSRSQDGDTVSYRSQRRGPGHAGLHLRYRIGDPLPQSQPGSLQHFLAERYLLYTPHPSGTLLRGQVHHSPYPLKQAQVLELDEDLLAAAGIPRTGPPLPPLYSPGVDVDIFKLEAVPVG